jgi:hypothetical protein
MISQAWIIGKEWTDIGQARTLNISAPVMGVMKWQATWQWTANRSASVQFLCVTMGERTRFFDLGHRAEVVPGDTLSVDLADAL